MHFQNIPGLLTSRPAGTFDTSHWPRYHCPKYSEIGIKCVVVLLVTWPKNVYYSLPKLDVSLKPYGNCALFPFSPSVKNYFFWHTRPLLNLSAPPQPWRHWLRGIAVCRRKKESGPRISQQLLRVGTSAYQHFLLGDGLPTFIVGADWPGIGPGRFKWQCQPVGLRVAWYRRNKIVTS